jgi:hypothetical protein
VVLSIFDFVGTTLYAIAACLSGKGCSLLYRRLDGLSPLSLTDYFGGHLLYLVGEQVKSARVSLSGGLLEELNPTLP